MASNGNAVALLVEGHEERLQRLEDEQRKVAAKVSECLVRIDYVGQAVEQSAESITEKLQAKIESESNKMIQSTGVRIERLEAAEKKRGQRAKNLKRAFWGAVAASGGAVVSKLAHVLLGSP